jgi:hypothetical protein
VSIQALVEVPSGVDPRSERFRAWAASLHHYQDKERLIAVFQVYLDESADAKKEKIFVIAGWMGTMQTWADFIPQWDDRIRHESIKSFHMADCEARRQEFSGWSLKRKNDLVRDLVGLIEKTEITAYIAGAKMADFIAVMDRFPVLRRFWYIRDPYYLLFNKCVFATCKTIDDIPGMPEWAQVSYLFDEHKNVSRKILQNYRWHKRDEKFVYRHRLGSLTFASRETVIPLQAADLLAYEVRKWQENLWVCPERPERKPFEVLKDKIDVGSAQLFDVKYLEGLLRHLAARFSDSRASQKPGHGHEPSA